MKTFLMSRVLFDSEIDELDFWWSSNGQLFQYGAADDVVFDCDLSPSQMRTVEASLGWKYLTVLASSSKSLAATLVLVLLVCKLISLV